MSANNDFQLHCEKGKLTFDVLFKEQSKSSKDSVIVNGRYYLIKGSQESIEWLMSKFPELTGHGLSTLDIEARLIHDGSKVSTIVQSITSQKTASTSVPKSLESANAYIDKLLDSEFFSGVVLLGHGENVVREVATDKMSTGFDVDTPFPILSIGKLVTAVSVMQLVESNPESISLDSPINQLLQDDDFDFEDFDPVFLNDCVTEGDLQRLREAIKNNDSITVRHLLTHTSGIVENENEQKGVKFDQSSLENERFNYSNLGYLLLASIVTNVSDEESFNDYIIHHVFEKAGMESAIECAKSDPKFKPKRYKTTLPLSEHLETTDALPKAGGYGILWMSARDLFRFATAFTEGKLVQPQTRDLMLQKPKNNHHGLGFLIEPGNPKVFGHDGGGPGANAGLRVISGNPPTTCIALSNYGRGEIASHELKDIALGNVLHEPYHVDQAVKEIYLELSDMDKPDDKTIMDLMNRIPIDDRKERREILNGIARSLSEKNPIVSEYILETFA